MTFNNRSLGKALLLSAIAFPPSWAVAQDAQLGGTKSASQPFSFETLTITATRSQDTVFDVPASVATLDRAQINEMQARDLAPILRSIPNVTMNGSPRPQGQIPTIRGLAGSEIIFSVDGARHNFADSVNSPLVLDPWFIQQVDVVRGASSALYGSGGIGGVMAFRTISPGDVLAPGQDYGAWSRGSYNSGNNGYSANITGATRQGDFEFLGGFTYRNYHAIDTPIGASLINGGNLISGLFKAGYALSDLNKFEFSYIAQSDSLKAAPTNPSGNNDFGLFQDLYRDQQDVTGSWTFQDGGEGLFDGKVTIYHAQHNLEGRPITAGVAATSKKIGTFGASIQNSSVYEMTSWFKHKLTYGFDYYEDTLHTLSNGAANPVNPDGTLESYGPFIQDEISIFEDWKVIAAVRNDTYNINAPGQASSSSNRATPKVTLKWQAFPFLSLYASYGEAFRAPTLTESFQDLITNVALFNFKPNPGLKPEKSRENEAGGTVSFDNALFEGDAIRIKGSVFNQNISDLISQITVGTYTRAAPFSGRGSIFQFQNISRAYRWGGELAASYLIDKFDLGIAYGQIRSKDRSNGANLFAPPDKVALNLGYSFLTDWRVHYSGQFVAAQDYDSTVLRQRPGYTVHDVGVAYTYDRYRVDFGVTNLFDEAYSTYQSSQATVYTYEESRSFKLTLNANF